MGVAGRSGYATGLLSRHKYRDCRTKSQKPLMVCVTTDSYLPLTMEQWVAAVFHVPESLIHVSLQITVRAR
jgi:hypothetical protein